MRIYKYLFALAMCATILGQTSCTMHDNPEEKQMVDGIYEGVGEGRGGVIKIAIDVVEHRIANARVLLQSESKFAQESIQQMIDRVLAAQTTEGVDVITGATITCTGVKDAMTMAINAAYGIRPERPTYADTSCDIVVIGAGGAGLTAAIEAQAGGAHVIVLEKRSIMGGNTNSSTGGINAAETRFQQNLGIADSKTIFFNDIMTGGHHLNDSILVQTLVEKGAPTLNWLSEFGVDLTDVGLMGGSSVARTHRPQGGVAIGPHLMMHLKHKATECGIDIRLGNKVTDVIRGEDGAVAGVEVAQADGPNYTISAKAVIIATGGFGANLDMVKQYRSELAGFSTVNHPGATGDAFSWVKKFDAQLYQMEQIQIHPTVEVSNCIMITEAVRGNGAILVNRNGKRFINELQTRDVVSAAILEQQGATAFLLFDQGVRESLSAINTYAAQGLLQTAQSLDVLSQLTGIHTADLNTTVNTYNTYQAEGEDKDFGRTAVQMPRALTTPPYYAIEVKPAIHHTMGGIHINEHCEVLKADGTPVRGLYAAGEVTGGVHGGNRLGGNGVADIVVFGRIAGAEATQAVKGE